MKRGSIYWVNLEEVSPPEFGKVRPGLIVSNSVQNFTLPSVVIIPISSQPPDIWPLRCEIDIPDKKASFAVIPGIRQVSKSKLQKLIYSLTESEMKTINEALEMYLND